MEFALRLAKVGGRAYNGINIHQEVVPDVPASHGCIRMHFKAAMVLFDMLDVGTTVNVYMRGQSTCFEGRIYVLGMIC